MGIFTRIKRAISAATPSRADLDKLAQHVSKQTGTPLVANKAKIFGGANRKRIQERAQKVDGFSFLHSKRTAELEAIEAGRQNEKGKLSARQRIELLLDPDSFLEIHQYMGSFFDDPSFKGSGVITGFGKVNGKKVAVYAQNFAFRAGTLGELEGKKICDLLDRALEEEIPVIALLDSGGARIQEGVSALGMYGEIFRRTVEASGVIPQISIILGPCAGGASYCPALTDFIIMTRENAQMFVTGPEVVKAVTGEEISADDLGGGLMHSETSGVCHYLADNEENALEYARVLLSFLPDNCNQTPQEYHYDDNVDDQQDQLFLDKIVPEEEKRAYDMLDVIYALADYGEFLEVHQLFAPSAIVGFARMDGKTCGIVANQPSFNSGTLDIDASEKIARFVRFCDAFSIPVLTLVDVPGYRPGSQQERAGIIRRGAKVITAYAEATVPLVTVILRKAYGGAYIVMGSKEIGADFNFAWPKAQIAVMGADGAVSIIHGRELREAKASGEKSDEEIEAIRLEYIQKYQTETVNTHLSEKRGSLDAVIDPTKTREIIIKSFEMAKTKKANRRSKKHDNQPL